MCENSDLSHLPPLSHPGTHHAVLHKRHQSQETSRAHLHKYPACGVLFVLSLERSLLFDKKTKTQAKHHITPVSRARSHSREGTASIRRPTACESQRGGDGRSLPGRRCRSGDTETPPNPAQFGAGTEGNGGGGSEPTDCNQELRAPGFVTKANGLGQSSEGLALTALPPLFRTSATAATVQNVSALRGTSPWMLSKQDPGNAQWYTARNLNLNPLPMHRRGRQSRANGCSAKNPYRTDPVTDGLVMKKES